MLVRLKLLLVLINNLRLAHCREKATSFVLKQKKQKFKSPPYASLLHKAITLQSQAAPRTIYILPRTAHRLALGYAKSKRPFQHTRLSCAARLSPKLGGDESS
jgi:hypothetical protein